MIVLPILFTAVLIVVIMQFILGFNVFGDVTKWAESIPVVRHVLGIPNPPVPVPQQVTALKKQLKTVQTTDQKQITALQNEVAKLSSELATAKSVSSNLHGKLVSTTTQLKAAQVASATAKSEAAILTNMSSNQAASVLQQLPFQEQVQALQAMNSSDQASLLSQLPVNIAAKLLKAGG